MTIGWAWNVWPARAGFFVLGFLLTAGCGRPAWAPPSGAAVDRTRRVLDEYFESYERSGAFSPLEREEIGLRLLKDSARTWREDLRAILFESEMEPRLRFGAGWFLAVARDRVSFRRVLRSMRDPAFRVPTAAAIEILGRIAERDDVPELTELLRQESSWARLCCAWALFHVACNYLGSPDQGIRGLGLHERWTQWWKKHGMKTETAWFRMGMESCLSDLRSDSPAKRASAVVVARALAQPFVPNVLGMPAEAEPWERWWREEGVQIEIGEASDLMSRNHSRPWTGCLSVAGPYWGAEEEGFEDVMRQDLRRRIESFRYGCGATDAEGVERLTDVEFSAPEWRTSFAEGLPNIPTIEDSPLGAAWTRWYDTNWPYLRWDWTRGHFVIARGTLR